MATQDQDTPRNSNARPGRAALRIAGIYVGVSLAYIVTSDLIVKEIAGSLAESSTFQTIKGICFVLFTGAGLWWLIRRSGRELLGLNDQLRASEELHRRLFVESPIATAILRNGTIDAVNEQGRQLLGDEAGLKGRRPESLAVEADRSRLAAAIGGTPAGAPTGQPPEYTIRGRDGQDHIVEVVTTPVRQGVVQVGLIDMTDRRRMDKVMRQAQKMEAVGSLAARMTHEFNNVLTAVLGHAAMARQAVGDDADVQRLISRIESVGQHAAGLTRSMLSLYHQAPSIRRRVDLATLLEEASELVRGVVPPTIRFALDAEEVRGVFFECDPAPFKQVLLNLAVNARDAMPQGGELTIRAERRESRAIIEVRDTGVGIAPEVFPHLFTPFFTTKPPEKGTGLGLPVTKGIVEEHGGTIKVESQPGKGALFIIDLPTCAPPVAASVVPPRADGLLLIVGEDNASVRGVLVESLRIAGFCVVAVGDGPGVIDAVKRNADAVSALIVDMALPGCSGVECLEEIRALHPDLPCVIMTGGEKPRLDDALRQHTAFLGKPFSGTELLATVNTLLGRRAAGAAR